ncbi:Interferon-induced, double-stranded RNA-activated protein kinase [Paramarasmius palmivorus]|uniref:Interferon-induced, double-stranded RNA-activated protein kinase n=1 Tax=Paramarasmius palmivorus TaxID=297713 RepID=A0AAW0AUH5_9AGAR
MVSITLSRGLSSLQTPSTGPSTTPLSVTTAPRTSGGGGGRYGLQLNNYCQRIRVRPEYATSAFGPPHDPTWSSIVYINGKEYGRGAGKTRVAAGDAAAKQALDTLERSQKT